MAAKFTYTLELFPTSEENFGLYVKQLDGLDIQRTDDNAGVDMICCQTQLVLDGHGATLLDLGVKARCWKVWTESGQMEPCHFWLAPRSSIWKQGVTQANSIGIIDKSYRGCLMGAVLPIQQLVSIEKGSRLFQVLAPDMGWIHRVRICPLDELDTTSRGEGGFGSTGK